MLKVFIWRVSNDNRFIQNAVTILKIQHGDIEIVGSSTGADIGKVDRGGVYDILLVVGAVKFGMSKIVKAARQFNLPEEKLLGDWIVCIPGFTLDKYRRLQRSRLSIFSKNCFGGIMSHLLGLPFRSPFVNMDMEPDDYIRILRTPRVHINEKPILLKMVLWKEINTYYPLVLLGDAEIHMNHYTEFNAAIDKWNKRKNRINWYNLFVTGYTDNEKILEEFDALPYGKKVCFVPFKSDLDSAWYINPEIDFDRNEDTFHDVVNNFARGKYFYYDVFDMLLYGKKTPLIDM